MSSDKHSDHLFLKSKDDSYTYGELDEFTAFFSSYLQKKKISNEQSIGILAYSCDEVIFIAAACWKLGMPFVCFDPCSKKRQLERQIKAINPTLIFTDDRSSGSLPEITAQLTSLADIKEFSKNQWLKDTEAIGGAQLQSGRHSENIFGYFFTSGTTGEPKIVPLKRRQMLSAACASFRNLKLFKNECWLLCMPMHHIGGISIILRSLIYESAIFRLDHFDVGAVGKLVLKKTEIKAVSLVPTMLKRLLDESKFKVHKQFKAILLGGGPVQTTLLNSASARKIPIIISYGMTETCAQIAARRVAHISTEEVSVGAVFEPNEIQIRDENGSVLSENESGNIWLKGPQVFDGYLHQKKSKFFDEKRWFNTGDFGRIDKYGKLYIESRRTDLIVTGGENVAPFEVAEALKKLDEIKAAGVTGLPDEEWGQIVAAAVVLNRNKKLSVSEIQDKLKKGLSGYKIPKKVVFVNELPGTATGKIKRDKLKEFF